MKQIPLTRGLFALVDDADFARLSQFKWNAIPGKKTWYAVRASKRKRIWMHREVTGLLCQIDHRNQNGLDNTRENLRAATHSQNHANQSKRRGSRSQYRGVCWEKAA